MSGQFKSRKRELGGFSPLRSADAFQVVAQLDAQTWLVG
jgi:hypothetical protein